MIIIFLLSFMTGSVDKSHYHSDMIVSVVMWVLFRIKYMYRKLFTCKLHQWSNVLCGEVYAAKWRFDIYIYIYIYIWYNCLYFELTGIIFNWKNSTVQIIFIHPVKIFRIWQTWIQDCPYKGGNLWISRSFIVLSTKISMISFPGCRMFPLLRNLSDSSK